MEGIIEVADDRDERVETYCDLLMKSGWEEIRFLLEEILPEPVDGDLR